MHHVTNAQPCTTFYKDFVSQTLALEQAKRGAMCTDKCAL